MKLSKGATREITVPVSKDILISAIAVQLQSLGTLKSVNLMDIVDIKFDKTDQNVVELKFVLKEEADVITF